MSIFGKIFEKTESFVAIGDTKAPKEKKLVSFEALKEAKLASLKPDNTGLITNNLFAIRDLIASIKFVPSGELIRHKKGEDWIGCIPAAGLYVISRMAFNAEKCKKDFSWYEESLDAGICNDISIMFKFWDYINEEKIGNKTLNNLMFNEESMKLFKFFWDNPEKEAEFKEELLLFLEGAAKVFAHLQMINIDAATTLRYPDLSKFAFARVQQTKGSGEERESLSLIPQWFCVVRHKKMNRAVFNSYSVQGKIFNTTVKEAANIKDFKPATESRLFDSQASAKVQTIIGLLYNNIVQATMLYNKYLESVLPADKDEAEKMKKQKDGAFKKIISLKINPLLDLLPLEEVLKAAYNESCKSLKEGGSAIRRSIFLKYFGEAAAIYFAASSKEKIFKARVSDEFAPCLKEGVEEVLVTDGQMMVKGVQFIGTTKAPDGEGKIFFSESTGYWISIIADENNGVEVSCCVPKNCRRLTSFEAELKIGLASYKGSPVKVVDIMVGDKKMGCVTNQALMKISSLVGKKVMVSFDKNDIEWNRSLVSATIKEVL